VIALLILATTALSWTPKPGQDRVAEAKEGMALLRQNTPPAEGGIAAGYDAVDCPAWFRTVSLDRLPKPQHVVSVPIYDRLYAWRVYQDTDHSLPCIVLETPGPLVLSREEAIIFQMARDGYVARTPEEVARDGDETEVRCEVKPADAGSPSSESTAAPQVQCKPAKDVRSADDNKR